MLVTFTVHVGKGDLPHAAPLGSLLAHSLCLGGGDFEEAIQHPEHVRLPVCLFLLLHGVPSPKVVMELPEHGAVVLDAEVDTAVSGFLVQRDIVHDGLSVAGEEARTQGISPRVHKPHLAEPLGHGLWTMSTHLGVGKVSAWAMMAP